MNEDGAGRSGEAPPRAARRSGARYPRAVVALRTLAACLALLLLGPASARSDEPEALPALLPMGGLSDEELARHWSPNPALAGQLRQIVRMREDESVEIRSFNDEEVQRLVGAPSAPTTESSQPVHRAGGAPIGSAPAAGIHGLNVARSGLNEIRQCVNGAH